MGYWKNKDSKGFLIIRKGQVGRAAGHAGPVNFVYVLLVFYGLGGSFFKGREDKNHANGTKQRNVCKEVLSEVRQPNILLRIY